MTYPAKLVYAAYPIDACFPLFEDDLVVLFYIPDGVATLATDERLLTIAQAASVGVAVEMAVVELCPYPYVVLAIPLHGSPTKTARNRAMFEEGILIEGQKVASPKTTAEKITGKTRERKSIDALSLTYILKYFACQTLAKIF